MESKLINYSIFIEKRPDMEIHTEVAIVSCINSAYVLLDGECASLISQVDKFNMVDDRSQLDTNHELYRTDFELGQLQEALVFQVQYVLNMGNDFTVGGGSYSIGNINSSYSRPEGRELIAPGVYKLLSNARVYHLNAFGSFSNHNTNEIPLSTSKEIMERVKNEYVAQNQPNAQVGNVAYINQSHQVSFGSPQDLQITTYNTNRIAGPEGYRNNFYEIDSVPNIAFFGPDYNGTYSAVHRQEMIDYVNQNAGENLGQEIAQIKQEQEEQNNKINLNKNLIDSTYEEVVDLLNITIPNIDKKILINTNAISSNKSFIDNLNQRVGANSNNIQTNTTNIQTNTNNITALDSRLVSVSGLLTQTIDGLRTLRPFQYVGEYQNGTSYKINQLVSYNNNLYLSKEDNNNTTPPSDKWLLINKDTISVDLSDYPTKLEVEAIKNNLQQSITSNTTNITNLNNEVVKLAGDQTITGAKTFDNQVIIRKDGTPLILRAVTPGKIYMLMKGADDTTNFSLGVNSSNTSLEVNRGDLTIQTLQSNKNVNFENVARVKLNRSVLETGTEINAGFGGGEVKFIPEDNSTKTLKFYNNQPNDTRRFKLLVPDPTEAQNPATKAYVDNAIQNITPGSGGSIDTSNFATLNTNQTISGEKTFTSAITLGTTINAGWGGNPVKFIPDDNSTKTLQFYNANATDQRRFNLLIAEPTQAQNPATKNYVDTAIAGINTSGNVPQQTLDQINTNTTNITNLQNEVSGQAISISSLETQVNVNVNRIGTNTNSINNLTNKTNTIEQNYVSKNTNTDQVIEGPITFRQRVSAQSTPSRASDLTNKQYVDNQISQIPNGEYNVIFSNTNTFNNQNTLSPINISSNAASNKPWIIQFDRKGSNGSKYEGTINYAFILPDINQATFADCTVYYNSSNKRFEAGARAGITILRTGATTLQFTFQCWDNGNRISNIKLLAPR